jgi:hypothetical protein
MWRGVQSPENSAAHDVTIVPLLNDIDLCVPRIGPLLGCDGDRTNRSHEGCGEGWRGGDVVGLGLRLDDQLDACALLQRLGEVALLAECNDVVLKGLKVAVGAGYSLMLPPSTTLCCHRSLRLQGRR